MPDTQEHENKIHCMFILMNNQEEKRGKGKNYDSNKIEIRVLSHMVLQKCRGKKWNKDLPRRVGMAYFKYVSGNFLS